MFWWPLTSTATGQLILNRKCYQVFKTEMKLHMINIIYAALPMREQTEKTTFSCKDDSCKTLHLYWSGVKDLFIDEAHTVQDIFRFAVFFSWHFSNDLIGLMYHPFLVCTFSYHYSLINSFFTFLFFFIWTDHKRAYQLNFGFEIWLD